MNDVKQAADEAKREELEAALRENVKKAAPDGTCPMIGVGTVLQWAEPPKAAMLQNPGQLGPIPLLQTQFLPCVEHKCMMWDDDNHRCLVRAGLEALVKMNARAAATRGPLA